MTRLPRPQFSWDETLTKENKNILKELDAAQTSRAVTATGSIMKGIAKQRS